LDTPPKIDCLLYRLRNKYQTLSESSAHDRQQYQSVRYMKNTEDAELNDDILTEYSFDYSKAKPNRFAKPSSNVTTVILDPDVARVFTNSEAVNKALRAILAALPNPQRTDTIKPYL